MSGGLASSVKKPKTGIHIPKEFVCVNKECYNKDIPLGKDIFAKYCMHCGQELEERVADLYIDIRINRYDPVPPKSQEEKEAWLDQPREVETHRISIREFIHLVKEYQKQVVIEEI